MWFHVNCQCEHDHVALCLRASVHICVFHIQKGTYYETSTLWKSPLAKSKVLSGSTHFIKNKSDGKVKSLLNFIRSSVTETRRSYSIVIQVLVCSSIHSFDCFPSPLIFCPPFLHPGSILMLHKGKGQVFSRWFYPTNGDTLQ